MNIQKNSIIRPTIYCYTTPNDKEHEGWCKIGYTDRDTAEHCVYKQTRRSDTQAKLEWESQAVFENGSYQTFMDHDFHKYLIACGIERKESVYEGKKAPEYFKITPEKARELLFQFKSLVEPAKAISKDYVLREEQDRAVNLTMDVMSKEGRHEVLLNAKPRFGKTLTVYNYCQRENFKRILIVTNRPVIATSWYNDYVKFLNTDTYRFVSNCAEVKDRQYCISREEWEKTNQADYNLIEFISLQDLKGSKYFGGQFNKLKEISDIDWDILIIDESHEGVETFKSEIAFKHIKRDRTIYLSGTPFKQVAGDKFEKGSIFNWTYADEQEKKHCWDYDIDDVNPYEELPQMNLFTYRLTDMFKKPTDMDAADVDKYFDLNEFFECNGSSFVNNADIDTFLDKLANDPRYPFANKEFDGLINHSLWLLDRVNSAKALARKLKEHPKFSQYKIVIAAGDGKIDDAEKVDKSFNKVVDAIAKYEKTITLSVGQLTTGVTIPEWSAVFMLCNVKSPSLYIQATFRAQNPCKTRLGDGSYVQKDNAYVFDFDPARTLDVMDQYANNLYTDTADGKGTEAQRLENIERLIKYFPIYGESETGEVIAYNATDVVTIPSKIKAVEIVKHGFMSNLLFQNIGRLFNDSHALEILGNVKSQAQYRLTTQPKYNEDGSTEIEDEDKIDEQAETLLEEVKDDSLQNDQNEFQETTNKQVIDFMATVKADAREESEKREKAHSTYIEERVDNAKKVVTTALDKSGSTIYNKSKIERDVTDGLKEKLTESQINYDIECAKRKEEYDKAMSQAISKEEMKELTTKQAQADADAELEHMFEMKLIENNFNKSIISDTIKESKETLQAKENKKAENEFAYPKLRAFSRAIPSFLMAYGDETTTCKTLARVINSEMFKEMTGIDLADYIYFIDKEYFNEAIFNSSIQEFLSLKDKLSNYFEDNEEDIFDYIPPQKTNQIFTPKKTVKMMVDFLEQNDPGCFDDPNHTFIDPYMKSGLYITEIVTRLFNNEHIKKAYPNDEKRLKHIFEKQVYGLAPTEILYKITTNFIFGFDKEHKYNRNHFVQLDANEYVGGKLQEKLDELFG